MNFTPLIGLAAIATIVWISIIDPSPRPEVLLDWRSMLLVLGGTAAVAIVIYPASRLMDLYRFVIYGIVLKKLPSVSEVAKQIVTASALGPGEHELYPLCPSSHPFLTEGYQLLAENILNEEDLHEVLTRRSQYFKSNYLNDAKILSTLGKFPSALGMLGSTVGLVDMMSGLSKMGQAGIGEAMALALVTTFWGLIFTYLLFMPLSDYAMRLNSEDTTLRQLIVEGILMIKRREDPRIIVDKINGFLALQDRLILKKSALPEDFWREAQYLAAKVRKKKVA